MFIKKLALAAAIVATSGTAFANDVVAAPSFTGLTATFAALHSAGAFMDMFTFTMPGITAANVSITTIGAGVADIDFTSATLNGIPVALTTDAGGYVELLYTPSDYALTGPLTLIVKGTSGANASYSGTLNVTAVPEPETVALMLAGLGVMGFVARRRRTS
nr:FxDxF family PEP-CTERM protein [uncultured Roseateles sp.]